MSDPTKWAEEEAARLRAALRLVERHLSSVSRRRSVHMPYAAWRVARDALEISDASIGTERKP